MEELPPKGFRRYVSARYLRQEIEQAFFRFPLTSVFAALATMLAIMGVIDYEYFSMAWLMVASFLGSMLSVAAVTWSEYLDEGRTSFPRQAVAFVATAVIAILFCFSRDWQEHGYAIISVFTFALVAILFLPWNKKQELKLSHSYTSRVLGNLLLAIFVAGCMAAFVGILMLTVESLFGIYEGRLFLALMVLLAVFLPIVVFLCRMPMVSDDTDVPGFTAPLAKNVLLIPALVYIAILYAYGLKILVEWEMPKAPIVWMVTGIVVVGLLIVFGMQGYVADTNAKPTVARLSRLVARKLPLLLLPLLLLMSVSIIYRIAQYGITTPRLYVATFNVWAYGAMIYLAWSRRAEMSKVAASFAGIFLAVSVIPGFNYCDVPESEDREEAVVEEEVETIYDTYWQSSLKVKLTDIPTSFTTIEYKGVANYENTGTVKMRRVFLKDDGLVQVPVDSLLALPEGSFVPCFLSVASREEKSFILTSFNIEVERDPSSDKIETIGAVRIEGYLLSK